MSRKSLVIDGESLVMALESHGFEQQWYLDLETGEVVPAPGDDDLEDELFDDDAPPRDESRYLPIDPIPSHEAFDVMRRFAESLPDERARDDLARALGGSRPFRRFKDALLDHPAEREEWFRYHGGWMRDVARDWVAGMGLSASLTWPLEVPGREARPEERI